MAVIPEFSVAFIEKAQAGDGAARDQLLRRLQPIVRSFFIKRIGLKADVDDLVQNTLLRVHRGLKDLNHTDRFKGFAMKAALYELQDFYRGRYRTREQLYDPALPPEVAPRGEQEALRIDLEQAMTELLSDRARRILELRAYGYRYQEIADMVGTTEAAVKMQVKRAFARLRDRLGVFIGSLVLIRSLVEWWPAG